MQNDHSWNRNRKPSSPVNTDAKYARIKQVTKTAIKKFSPFLLTGFAAVAEHHWLKKDADENERGEGRSREGGLREEESYRKESRGEEACKGSEVKELREEVAKLRGYLERGSRNREAGREGTQPHSLGSPRLPSLVRHPRSLCSDDIQRREEEFTKMPFAPTPPFSFAAPFEPLREANVKRPRQLYDSPSLSSSSSDSLSSRSSRSRVRDRHREGGLHLPLGRSRSRHRYGRHHRRFSVPRRISRRPHTPHHLYIASNVTDIIQAGKVAAVAGLVEALHVEDGKGDWIGKKGLRVGTSAAASFGATYGRERERGGVRYGMKEVILDVGTGVMVSGLLFGRVGSAEEKTRSRLGGGRRRWSSYL